MKINSVCALINGIPKGKIKNKQTELFGCIGKDIYMEKLSRENKYFLIRACFENGIILALAYLDFVS